MFSNYFLFFTISRAENPEFGVLYVKHVLRNKLIWYLEVVICKECRSEWEIIFHSQNHVYVNIITIGNSVKESSYELEIRDIQPAWQIRGAWKIWGDPPERDTDWELRRKNCQFWSPLPDNIAENVLRSRGQNSFQEAVQLRIPRFPLKQQLEQQGHPEGHDLKRLSIDVNTFNQPPVSQ